MTRRKRKRIAAPPADSVPDRNECFVYDRLVGDGTNELTQRQLHARTGMPVSTINGVVRRLAAKRYIRKSMSWQKTDILYAKGANSALMEEYIRRNPGIADPPKAYGQVVACPGKETRVMITERVNVCRPHLAGGCLVAHVMKEGALSTFAARRGDGTVTSEYLFTRKPKHLRGVDQWTCTYRFERDAYSLVYMRALKESGSRIMKLYPPYLLLPISDVKTEEQMKTGFRQRVMPLLRHLEKFAGWIFLKDDSGVYIVDCKGRLEYAFDSGTTEIVKEHVGDGHGIPGRTVTWVDRSDTSIGDDGEFETSSIDYAKALDRIPETTAEVQRHGEAVQALEKRVRRLEEHTGLTDGGFTDNGGS